MKKYKKELSEKEIQEYTVVYRRYRRAAAKAGTLPLSLSAWIDKQLGDVTEPAPEPVVAEVEVLPEPVVAVTEPAPEPVVAEVVPEPVVEITEPAAEETAPAEEIIENVKPKKKSSWYKTKEVDDLESLNDLFNLEPKNNE